MGFCGRREALGQQLVEEVRASGGDAFGRTPAASSSTVGASLRPRCAALQHLHPRFQTGAILIFGGEPAHRARIAGFGARCEVPDRREQRRLQRWQRFGGHARTAGGGRSVYTQWPFPSLYR